MMEKKLIHKLISLAKFDSDAVQAFARAIEQVDSDHVADLLKKLKSEQERHVLTLRRIILDMGGKPPEQPLDGSTFQIQELKFADATADDEKLLEICKSNAKFLCDVYLAALSVDLTPKIETIIKRHCEDENHHLQELEKALADKIWLDQPLHIERSAS